VFLCAQTRLDNMGQPPEPKDQTSLPHAQGPRYCRPNVVNRAAFRVRRAWRLASHRPPNPTVHLEPHGASQWATNPSSAARLRRGDHHAMRNQSTDCAWSTRRTFCRQMLGSIPPYAHKKPASLSSPASLVLLPPSPAPFPQHTSEDPSIGFGTRTSQFWAGRSGHITIHLFLFVRRRRGAVRRSRAVRHWQFRQRQILLRWSGPTADR
jgi:hypothetical protein